MPMLREINFDQNRPRDAGVSRLLRDHGVDPLSHVPNELFFADRERIVFVAGVVGRWRRPWPLDARGSALHRRSRRLRRRRRRNFRRRAIRIIRCSVCFARLSNRRSLRGFVLLPRLNDQVLGGRQIAVFSCGVGVASSLLSLIPQIRRFLLRLGVASRGLQRIHFRHQLIEAQTLGHASVQTIPEADQLPVPLFRQLIIFPLELDLPVAPCGLGLRYNGAILLLLTFVFDLLQSPLRRRPDNRRARSVPLVKNNQFRPEVINSATQQGKQSHPPYSRPDGLPDLRLSCFSLLPLFFPPSLKLSFLFQPYLFKAALLRLLGPRLPFAFRLRLPLLAPSLLFLMTRAIKVVRVVINRPFPLV